MADLRGLADRSPGSDEANPLQWRTAGRLRPDDASVSIARLRHNIPKPARKSFARANRFANMSDHARAVSELEASVLLDPGFAAAYERLGTEYGHLKRFDEAAAALRRSLELDASSWTAHYNLAVVLFQSGDLSGAEQSALRALRGSGANDRVHWILGYLLCQSKATQADGLSHVRFAARTLPEARRFLLGLQMPPPPLPHASPYLRISVVSGRPVVDGVFLNGLGPWRFLLDTGAQTNQIEASLATKLGVTPTFRLQIATVSGSALVPGGTVSEVTLGSASASSQEFLFTSLNAVHALASDIHGVLGQEFLSHFNYLLDFAGRTLVFGAAETAGGRRTEMNLVDGLPVLKTDRGRFVLDSGTETAILFAESSVATGTASVSPVRNMRFRIAGKVYLIDAASIPRVPSGQVSSGQDGLLPASLFHSVYVSNSDGYLILNPTDRPNKRITD